MRPPRLAYRLLNSFLKNKFREEVAGDLEERFLLKLQSTNRMAAHLDYWIQVINYLRPFAVRYHLRHSISMLNHSLLKSYLLMAFRVFRKNLGHTLVSVLGLAVALSCSFFIYQWVQDEWSYNRFLTSGDRVVNVLNRETQTDGRVNTYRYSPYRLKAVLDNEYPIVEKATILSKGNWMAFEIGEEWVEWDGVDASPEFFELFEVPFIKGGFQEMFDSDESIAISESIARTYFGEDWEKKDVVGHLMVNDQGGTNRIIGVYKDFPKQSTLKYKFVVPYRNLLKIRKYLKSWDNTTSHLYLKLRDGVPIEEANKQLLNAIIDHRQEASAVDRELFLQPFRDMYLYSRIENGSINGGRIEYLKLFSVSAIFVSFLACINFMNITTARSTQRAKETGVRKVLGASKQSLRSQFLIESLLSTMLAAVVAAIFVVLLADPFTSLTGKELSIALFSWMHMLYLIGFVLIVGLFSGLYPAFVMSSTKIIHAFKGLPIKAGNGAYFRKALVILQFTITMMMIIGALVIYQQVSFIQSKSTGLDRSNLIRSYTYDMDPVKEYARYKESLMAKKGIESVTLANQLLINIRNSTSQVAWDSKLETDDLAFYVIDGNPDFLETTKIRLKTGRNFSWAMKTDTANFLINEAAQRLMKMEEPVGENLSIWGMKGKIVGVVEDFHNASLHSEIKPLIIRNDLSSGWMVLTRAKEGMQQEAIASLEEVFYEFNKNRTFWFRFMEDIYSSQYRNELLIKKLAGWFTAIAMIISMFGLLSLVLYATQRRTKEVGIRKVLGASVAQVYKILSLEYVYLIAISLLLAVPISGLLMSRWLEGFAYRISLDAWLFVVAAAASLLVSYLVISYNTIKVAVSNPVNYLREE